MALPPFVVGNHDLLCKTQSNLFEIIDSAIAIAALRWPQDLQGRRDHILHVLNMGLLHHNDDQKDTTMTDRHHQLGKVKGREKGFRGNDDVIDHGQAKKKPPQSRPAVVEGQGTNKPHDMTTAVGGVLVQQQQGRSKDAASTKAPPPPAAVPAGRARVRAERVSDADYEKKLASSKRKLHEGYRAYEESRRRKRSRVIDSWADVPEASKAQVFSKPHNKPKAVPAAKTNTNGALSSKPSARPIRSSGGGDQAGAAPHQKPGWWTRPKNELSNGRQPVSQSQRCH